MKIHGTDFLLSMTRGDKIDTMHLNIGGLYVNFTSWQDFSQDGAPFLSLKNNGVVVASIQGKAAILVIEALYNYGMR
jgi:hypothetical protein